MMRRGAGFTTLTMSVLLLAILSTGSLFIGKSLVAEQRLALNEIEYRLTHAAAEQGVAEAIAMFSMDPNVNGLASSVSHELGEINYQVHLAPHGSLNGIHQLDSTASLPSGARSRIRMALAERSILSPLHSGPYYPLLLAGANTVINGQLHIVVNQVGANQANSVWSAGELSVSGALHSCHESDYDEVASRCNVSLSQIDALEQRLEPDMQLQDAAFPADLLHYLFGYHANQGRHIDAMATARVQDCSEIKRAGFYLVSGGANCQLDRVVSSRASPVILLVKDMAITGTLPTQFYGLLIWLEANNRILSLANGSELIGGLVVGLGNGELKGNFTLRYDEGLLCTLSVCQPSVGGNPFRLLSVLPGSWHDD